MARARSSTVTPKRLRSTPSTDPSSTSRTWPGEESAGVARPTRRSVRPAVGRAFLEPPEEPEAEPWEALALTDEQRRNNPYLIPPDQRPRVVLRYGDSKDLLVSGLLEGGKEIAQHAAIIDVPLEKGHVVLF